MADGFVLNSIQPFATLEFRWGDRLARDGMVRIRSLSHLFLQLITLYLKAENEPLFGAIASGLLVLLAIISISVMGSAPESKSAWQKQNLLQAHGACLYFIDAEIMARQVFPATSARWSHYPLDAESACTPIGNNVWHASGTVKMQMEGLLQSSTWEVYFLPDDRKPIFVRVGDVKSGDYNAALRMTGISEANRRGAADEK